MPGDGPADPDQSIVVSQDKRERGAEAVVARNLELEIEGSLEHHLRRRRVKGALEWIARPCTSGNSKTWSLKGIIMNFVLENGSSEYNGRGSRGH